LVNGAGTFSATLSTSGSQTITATDTVNSAIAGTSNAIAVASSAVTHFSVSAPSAASSGSPINFTVTALDSNNATVTNYTGTVRFSSSDGVATLPANSTLTNGVGTFPATLRTPGNEIITATDSVISVITGSSSPILVSAAATPPVPVSVTPNGGSNPSENYTFVYSDPRGWQDLNVVNALVNNFIDGRRACYLAYVVPQSYLALVDDAGDAGGPFAGTVALGNSAPIQNSQCSVTLVSAQGSGNTFTLVLSIAWTNSFAGDKIIHLAARDLASNNSGWYPLGVLRAPGGTATTTTAVVSANPSRATGFAATTYTFSFSDTKGFADLGVENILVNSALDGRHGCYLAFSRPGNVMYLVNDNGDALLPAQSMATAGSISNSQCSVTWTGGAVSESGNNLSLTLNITFSASFAGNRIIYTAARDVNEANNTDWHAMATWASQ
jgi:hypothetical protein